MARVDVIFGLPVTMIFIVTVAYFRSILQANWDKVDIVTVSAVEDILTSMNTSVDPCDDFYDYACQRWSEKNSRPDDTTSWSIGVKLEKETTTAVRDILESPISNNDFPALVLAKQFYRKCINVHEETEDSTDLQAMLNVLDEYGGWPILHDHGNWNSSKFNWINSTAGLHQRFLGTALLRSTSFQFPPWTNITNTIIFFPPKDSIYSDKNLIVNISKTFLEFQGKTDINETYLEEKADEIVTVGSDLWYIRDDDYEFWRTIKKCLDVSQCESCNFMTFDEIQAELNKSSLPKPNKLDIRLFLEAFYTKSYTYFNKGFVIDFEYLRELGIYLTSFRTDEEIANFLHYQMVVKMIPLTGNKVLNDLLANFDDSNWNVTGKNKISMDCASTIKDKFYPAIGKAYVDLRDNLENDFEVVRQMYKNIKESVRNLTIKYAPLPYATTLKALEIETDKTHLCLGYPSWMKETNSSVMQATYKDLELNQSESFLSQSMAFNMWYTHFNLESFKKLKLEASEGNYCFWPFFPGSVNAFNTITHNLVYLPIGYIQPPLFNTNLSLAINYGTFGSIIGHEIVHGLLVPHLLESRSGGLTPLAECLVQQYGQFRLSDADETWYLDGKRTLHENTADNLGLLAALKAFQKINSSTEEEKKSTSLKGFTNEQLFFLGFAQTYCENSTPKSLRYPIEYTTPWFTHAPRKFRVLGTLQNLKEFSEAWNCPVKSKMNPRDSMTLYRLFYGERCL